MNDRLSRLRAALDTEGLDAFYVSGPVDDIWHVHQANRRWLTGFEGSAGRAIVTSTDALMILDGRYETIGRRQVEPRGFRVYPIRSGLKQWFAEVSAEAHLAGKKVGVSKADMSLDEWSTIQQVVAEMPPADRPEMVPAPKLIEKLRAIKDAEEIAALQVAIDIGDTAFEEVARWLEPGVTEREVAAAITTAVRRLGAPRESFDAIVASGLNGALPHAQPTDDPIARGAAVTIDMGAYAQGYNSDLTRTVVAGGGGDAKFREVYQVVFEAQQNAIDRVEAGMTGVAAHDLAASVIEKAGYGDQFVHGLGHGVGLEVHESPGLGRFSEDTLADGMTFTIEPGIYIPGWGGVRIEDVVVLENGRARQLSHATKLTLAGV